MTSPMENALLDTVPPADGATRPPAREEHAVGEPDAGDSAVKESVSTIRELLAELSRVLDRWYSDVPTPTSREQAAVPGRPLTPCTTDRADRAVPYIPARPPVPSGKPIVRSPVEPNALEARYRP
ncbi:hypothetical protein I5Q34_32355 [Streptomyces sp. AV19]|uniref:hypothetical protein n=1 Tax=Streptomyces sp. AV19 TaxID=2793068 RepID=UPI0018FEA713|nr:hypothetical protein [Streptomyces sp. AV19]MBH1938899.1 hypothetical protein [Streptomyces sp. AV19]MDG4533625.1 hypothetical protein [Streptomyces sp. AV19]